MNATRFPYILKMSLVISTVGITSCMLGPNFHHPAAPNVEGYTAEPLPKATASAKTLGGEKQYFRKAHDIPREWWRVFHSKELEQVVAIAMQNNPDLQSATAALKIAHENTVIQQTAFFPFVQGSFNPNNQLTAGTLASNLASNAYLYSLYTTQLSISYAPDVLGLNRRQVESLKASEEQACFQREAVYLTLASNVVSTVIQEASTRAQIAATERSIALTKRQYKLMHLEQTLGQIGSEGVFAQEALLAQYQSGLPPLQKQLAQLRHTLAALCGRFPSEILAGPFTLESLHLPQDLPVTLPSKLIEQRPDIRAAEAQMHAASAQIGVAIANRLPVVNLIAYGGTNPLSLATLFASGTGYWLGGANVVGPLFDAGALRHKQKAAIDAYEASVAQYRSVVLLAFQNVADTLSAIEIDANALKIATIQYNAAYKSLSIVKQKWMLGSVGYLDILNAEATYQRAIINLVQSQSNRFLDTAALFQALGGGWA